MSANRSWCPGQTNREQFALLHAQFRERSSSEREQAVTRAHINERTSDTNELLLYNASLKW